jgi:uncharacterized protein YecE (DUF72 family)
MRVAVEFRPDSWQCEETFALLAAHEAAYCVMSGAHLPCVLRATTNFAYVRMHGPDRDHLYAGSYSDADLSRWADRVRERDRAGRARAGPAATPTAPRISEPAAARHMSSFLIGSSRWFPPDGSDAH